jgi:hypothetical protein
LYLSIITQWSLSGYSLTLRLGTHLSRPLRWPTRIAVSFIPQITSVGTLMISDLTPWVTSFADQEWGIVEAGWVSLKGALR